MQNKYYDIIVLLLTDNSSQIIDRSIQSILNQTFRRERVKIVVVDNHSTDGTYEKLIEYVKSNNISIYRLDKKYLKTRLMLQANQLLRFTQHKYLTILSPGDMLYPNFLEKCASLLDDDSHTDTRVILCHVDLMDNDGRIFNQPPIFEKDRILEKKKHFVEVLNCGLGHKVQCFYRCGMMPVDLFELPHFVDFTDCFMKAWYLMSYQCMHLKENLACVSNRKYSDKIDDLALRLYFITRLKVFRETVNNEGTAFLDGLYSEEISINLSKYALRYASEALADGDTGTANKILLFAEMIFEDIIHTEYYSELKKNIESRRADKTPDQHQRI